ncbi:MULTISPECIES: thiamine pyrophosphate-binding protein [Delftia]|uniref:Acetolactate synthase-1/2/3 large subunit n=1 Tax=Delftia lacustris TaxID=558537 RepID=A0A1H3EX32_9BURK|nr:MULTISPECIES: thiamine pyrophosphate-binding protein [Delftia]PZP73986.1 MAG: thiamine pyrophosphate-binding protein [Delftia acidovorans]EPD36760.1 acetolactate synthase I/II/III large subunit [Delftia acidovorans CCUG 274B]KAF1046450.1 MAG: Acetolactate synthase large subunit [Delftia tsuruhatensis]MCX7505539.1 thiamine pyrophosphate-binding protein [Delftia tsuruhatensis]MDR6727844.1 acetolactate synthase-1/2/3 large subunit [Delftia lacustris]
MTTAFNGADAMVRMLQLNGVKHIFGLCGDTSLPFYDAMARLDHGMDHILTRDERSAGYMADAYARVTGKVGVCEGPSGGGATYLLPGLAEANESSVPVLGITSDVSVGARGKFPLTELDQQALYRPLTKWNTTIDRVDQIPHAVRSAFRAMTTGRPGATHICLPYDVQKHALDPADVWAQPGHDRYPAYRSAPDPAAVAEAADRLVAARSPVLICGGGVLIAGAGAALDALATLLNAPVCSSVSGQGSLAGSHPLNAGVVGTNGGVEATRAVVAQADLVMFIGARAGSTTTEHWQMPSRKVTIVHLDVDAMTIGTNYRTDVALVGDALLGLQALHAAVQQRIARRPADAADGAALAATARAAKLAFFAPLAASLERPIKPERVVDTLNRLLPARAIVVADPGTPCPYFTAYFDAPQAGRHFITNRAHGALGFAMSAGFGAAIGQPDSVVVAVMGDGSFGFTCGELETIVRRNVPLKMIVFSNSVFGWIKASQKSGYDERYFSVDFNRTHHARVAEAFGVKAWRVEDPADLEAALKAALMHDGPALVDVISQELQDTAVPVSQWMG